MSSNADSDSVVQGAQADEQDSQKNVNIALNTLLEDLDGRLEELRDKAELCDRVLRDLRDLRGILADKDIGDGTTESTPQDHSD